MTRPEDEFRPRLGRIRAGGGRASKRYLGKLYAAIEKASPGAFAKRSASHFTGARIGRGAGLGAAFAMRGHPFAKFRARRVAVKIRSVRLGKAGLGKARAHLRYIQRDGAEKDGTPGRLYGPARDSVDGGVFLDDGKDDRHQFRIILSPEDAGELEDLGCFTRDLMAAAERDLETRLDWVAVNHFDTDHPHVHVVLRGRTEDGKDLVIARSYITHGFRRRAEELATLELGPRRDLDIAQTRMREAGVERLTSLDRELKDLMVDGVVDFGPPKTPYDRFRMKLLTTRLRTLEKMGLASRARDGWRLSAELEPSLREMGRRGDIIRSMDRAFGAAFAPANLRDFAENQAPPSLIGRVAGSGAADEAHDKRFLAVDGADGNQWHVTVDLEPGAMPPKGAVIELLKSAGAPRKSDLVIAAISERNGGVYSDALHSHADPRSSAEFRLTHVRRLEALRSAGIVERQQDGSWRVPEDFLERAAAFESGKSGARIRVLSWVALDQSPDAQGPVFLDGMLEERTAVASVHTGFGHDLAEAVALRRRWLLANELAQEASGRFVIDQEKLRGLEQMAISATTARLSAELGKAFAPPVEGERLAGVYRRPIDLAAGRFALIEKSKEFTLVPWRDVLEPRRGLEIAGVVGRGGITWSFGKNRGGPAI